MLFWLLIILLVLFSSAQASKPICDGRCTAPVVSIFSRASNSRFFSGLARGCRPPRSDHINHDNFINFQPISTKFKFYQSPTPDLQKSSAMLDSKIFQSCFGPKSERCMIQLLCELITLAIQLKLNNFKNDFILSIIYGVIPVLFFRLHQFQVWRALMFESNFKAARKRCCKAWDHEYESSHREHDKYIPHWRPYRYYSRIEMDKIAFNRCYPTDSYIPTSLPTLPATKPKKVNTLPYWAPVDLLHRYLVPIISTTRFNDPYKVCFEMSLGPETSSAQIPTSV